MQFYTAGLANALVGAGAEVWVMGAATERRQSFEGQARLLSHYSFASTGLSMQALNPVRFGRLLQEIQRIGPDLVHITGPHLWNLPLVLKLRRWVPVVFTVHEPTPHRGATGMRTKHVYQRWMVQLVNRVVVHSQFVGEESKRHWGTPSAKLCVMPLVHLNFDYQRYRHIREDSDLRSKYENSALLYGRLEEYKGIREFIAAARLLAVSTDLSVNFIVAGSGSLSSELEEFEPLPGLEIRNRQLGDDETIDLFSRVGLLVLPYSEGSQSALVPLAYLFEKPVLVTRVGALPEYVRDGVTGRIVESNQPTLLAQVIRQMLRDKGELVRMGRAGRDFLEELEQAFLDGLLLCYERALSE
jgi:glycosyltransferase involved in cell wall biosynthesis